MSHSIGHVVGKGTECKRIFVQIVRFGDKRENEIAAPNIVREITKELAAERIVAHVLNDGASIGISMGPLQFLWSRAGKTLQQQRLDPIIPCRIDNRFMTQDRVACTTRNKEGAGKGCQEKKEAYGKEAAILESEPVASHRLACPGALPVPGDHEKRARPRSSSCYRNRFRATPALRH